jgi:hypothetical protein
MGHVVRVERTDGLRLTELSEVEGVVVREVEQVKARPRERRGVLGRRLEAEAVPSFGFAFRGVPHGERALQIADRDVRADHLVAYVLEQAPAVVGRQSVARARRDVSGPRDRDLHALCAARARTASRVCW